MYSSTKSVVAREVMVAPEMAVSMARLTSSSSTIFLERASIYAWSIALLYMSIEWRRRVRNISARYWLRRESIERLNQLCVHAATG